MCLHISHQLCHLEEDGGRWRNGGAIWDGMGQGEEIHFDVGLISLLHLASFGHVYIVAQTVQMWILRCVISHRFNKQVLLPAL